MEEILHQLGYKKSCISWVKLPTSTGERRISSIISMLDLDVYACVREYV